MNDDTAPAPSPELPPRQLPPRRGRTVALLLALTTAVAAGGWFGWRHYRAAPPTVVADRGGLDIDLATPDALIESASLANLPRDLLRVPLLRDALTEEFVFYYESNADRMGLAGSLRRIAYEHDLELRDSLIQELLSQPGTIALWRGADGKLKHSLLVLQRGALAKLLEPLARVALNDKQLAKVGELEVAGERVALLRLRYGSDRALLFASRGDRVVVLSTPELLLQSDEKSTRIARDAQAQVVKLLGAAEPYPERFGLERRAGAHRISLRADYFTFGYQAFFPALAGVRFEMNDTGWQGFLALGPTETEQSLDFRPLWNAMPMGASACAGLPVTARDIRPLMDRFAAEQKVDPALAAQLAGPAALCWYGKSHLHTPLLAVRLAKPGDAAADALLGAAFDTFIGTGPREQRAAVEAATDAAGPHWAREVTSNFGIHNAGGAGLFKVTMARRGDLLLFSLDDDLVQQALATVDKRFPPISERMPAGRSVPAMINPATLATLLEQETLNSLPANLEALFRNSAERNLLPKLRAMGKHGAYALTLPENPRTRGEWNWLPLQWAPL